MIRYHIFNILNTISFLLFLLTIIGNQYFSSKVPIFTSIFQLYVGCLLVYQFNMFMKPEITKTDQKIIFTAGSLLIVSQLINLKYIYQYVLKNTTNVVKQETTLFSDSFYDLENNNSTLY